MRRLGEAGLMAGEIFLTLWVFSLFFQARQRRDFDQRTAQQEATQSRLLARLAAARAEAENLYRMQKIPPPLLLSEEAKDFQFELGSAELPPAFQHALELRIIPRLEALAVEHGCGRLEVVGHTDGVPLQGRGRSNLDRRLLELLSAPLAGGGRRLPRLDDMVPGSNADLGLLRAAAVVRFLRQQQALHGRLGRITQILPYTAAQVADPGGGLAPGGFAPAPARRRIEIRLLRAE